MLRIIRKYPLYLFLLPIFFVLHGYVENLGFIDWKEAMLLLLSYFLLTASIAGFSYLFFRNWNRAALITVFWMAFFFFFGAVHEFMMAHSPIVFFSRYSFLLGLALCILFGLFVFFRKSKKPFQRFSIYLNALFLVYILTDLGIGLWKSILTPDSGLAVYQFESETEYHPCDTCAKPNIYFLLYDEYGNSKSLEEQFGFHNNLDSILLKKNFIIQTGSQSNYNFTPFSMASVLNMKYLDHVKNPDAVTLKDYTTCNLLIRNNEVIRLLDREKYEIVNYSIFDLAGNPSPVDQSFLPLKTKLISDRTLFAHMNKDIGWLLVVKWPFSLLKKNYFLRHRYNNEKFQELVLQASRQKTTRPRFIYSHFYLPHVPYFYDRHGNLRDLNVLASENEHNPYKPYLEYLLYANTQITKLVESIQHNDPTAVILLLSDHGYRQVDNSNAAHFFRNLNAVYLPEQHRKGFYQNMTSVNFFRVLLNELFHQKLPLLADSTIRLTDGKAK